MFQDPNITLNKTGVKNNVFYDNAESQKIGNSEDDLQNFEFVKTLSPIGVQLAKGVAREQVNAIGLEIGRTVLQNQVDFGVSVGADITTGILSYKVGGPKAVVAFGLIKGVNGLLGDVSRQRQIRLDGFQADYNRELLGGSFRNRTGGLK